MLNGKIQPSIISVCIQTHTLLVCFHILSSSTLFALNPKRTAMKTNPGVR